MSVGVSVCWCVLVCVCVGVSVSTVDGGVRLVWGSAASGSISETSDAECVIVPLA